jgi:hypothetical protein
MMPPPFRVICSSLLSCPTARSALALVLASAARERAKRARECDARMMFFCNVQERSGRIHTPYQMLSGETDMQTTKIVIVGQTTLLCDLLAATLIGSDVTTEVYTNAPGPSAAASDTSVSTIVVYEVGSIETLRSLHYLPKARASVALVRDPRSDLLRASSKIAYAEPSRASPTSTLTSNAACHGSTCMVRKIA